MKRIAAGIAIGSMFAALAVSAAQQTKAPPQKNSTTPAYTPAEVASGKQQYSVQCAVCHFANSTAKKIGPGLKSIYSRGKFAGGEKVDDESMRKWIYNGGKDMPAFKDSLKPNEVRDLLAYLHTL